MNIKMKITRKQLQRIIKEEKAKLMSEIEISDEQMARINAEQSQLQSQAEVSRLMSELNDVIDRLITVLGPDGVALELEGIAHDLMGQ